jgi:hypothetical protein
MTKWIWRLFDPAEHNSLWFKLLQAKYFNTDNIFATTSQGGPSSGAASIKLNTSLSWGLDIMWKMGRKPLSGLTGGWEMPHLLSDSQDFSISPLTRISR